MYLVQNARIVSSGERLTFRAPKTGNVFVLIVHFVAETDRYGRVVKGVRFSAPNSHPFPKGAQLLGAGNEPFQPNDPYLLPKRINSCSLTDTDGANYELCSVELVDQGEDLRPGGGNTAGGVLHFPATAAIPPELGGEGILRDDPSRYLE